MTPAQRKAMYAETEKQVRRILMGDITAEQLFWLRVEIGMDHARDLHGAYKGGQIFRKKAYWTWFLQTWHINDKKILHELNELQIDEITLEEYADTQMAKMARWKINETVL